MAVGGWHSDDDGEDRRKEVLLLEGLDATWRTTARLGIPTQGQAGVLLGDTLLCLGGYDAVRGVGPVGGVRGGMVPGAGVGVCCVDWRGIGWTRGFVRWTVKGYSWGSRSSVLVV